MMNEYLQDQLPESCDQHELEENSIRAVLHAFKSDRFVIRGASGIDAGTDRIIEAKFKGSYTNCTAYAQIKSMQRAKPNLDGSISEALNVSNVNYMRNGNCPIYILWIADINELRYVWARDIPNFYDYDWRDQGTLTVRFRDVIDEDALNKIHKRIIDESIMSRDIRENICKYASATSTYAIDKETLKVTTPENAKMMLQNSGMETVLCGNILEVERLYNLLDDEDKYDPNALLPLSYAYIEKGDYDSARSVLRKIAVKENELRSENRHLYDWIENFCDYMQGKKDINKYIKDLDEINNAISGIDNVKFQMEIEFTKYLKERLEILNSASAAKKSEAKTNLYRLCELVKDIPDEDNSLAHTASIIKSVVDGMEILERISDAYLRAHFSLIGGTPPDQEVLAYRAAVEDFKKWYCSVLPKINYYERVSNKYFYFYVVTQESTVITSFLNTLAIGGDETLLFDGNFYNIMLNDTITRVEHAIKYFESARMTNRLARARLTQMSLYELAGEFDKSKAIARAHISEISSLFDDEKLISQYRDHLCGESVLGLQRARLNSPPTLPSGVELKRIIQMCQENGVPISEDDLFDFHNKYKKMQSFCRNMFPLESLQTPGLYKIACLLNKCQGDESSGDLEGLFDSFAEKQCSGCTSRTPHEIGVP